MSYPSVEFFLQALGDGDALLLVDLFTMNI
jgi:hypothetical protein